MRKRFSEACSLATQPHWSLYWRSREPLSFMDSSLKYPPSTASMVDSLLPIYTTLISDTDYCHHLYLVSPHLLMPLSQLGSTKHSDTCFVRGPHSPWDASYGSFCSQYEAQVPWSVLLGLIICLHASLLHTPNMKWGDQTRYGTCPRWIHNSARNHGHDKC